MEEYRGTVGSVRVIKEGACKKCNVKFRTNIKPVQCDECKGKFHKSCTGVNRYHLDKLDKWTCSECNGETNNSVKKPVNLRKTNCDICGRPVRSDQGVECKNCAKRVHKKCAGFGSRVAMTRVLEQRGYECNECKDDRMQGARGSRIEDAQDNVISNKGEK